MDALRSPSAALAAWRAELAASRRSPWLASLVLRHATAIARRAAAIHARLVALPRRTRRRLAKQWALALPVAALAIARSGGGAEAATIHVGDGCTLVDAIHAANGDEAVGGCAAGSGADTVVLGGGTYAYEAPSSRLSYEAYDVGASALPPVRSEIVIEGSGATIERRPEGEASFRLLFVAREGSLRIEDVVLQGGWVDDWTGTTRDISGGGGAILSLGELELVRSTVRDNHAYTGGGIMSFSDARTRIVDSSVRGNVATIGAGLLNTGSLTLVSSRVTDNDASNRGGGLMNHGGVATFAHAAKAELLESRVEGNQAFYYGGGIANIEATLLVAGGHITGNEATEPGGGIVSVEGEVEVRGATLEGNAPHAVLVREGALEMQDVQSLRNQGSSVYVRVGEVVLLRSTFSGNVAEDEPGGALQLRDATLRMEDCDVSGNTSTWSGGGLALYGSTAVIRRSRFRGNQARPSAGGIFIDGGETRIEESEIFGNRAGSAGGVSGSAHILRSVIEGNRASEGAGGVVAEHLRLEDSRVVDNRGRDGGGIGVERAEVFRSSFIGNEAMRGGGIHAGQLEIRSSTLRGNTASEEGGALFASGASLVESSTLAENQAPAGAAIFADGQGLRLRSATIVGNAAEARGAAVAVASRQGPASVRGSILARNEGGDCTGPLRFTGAGNLIDDHAAGACADIADAAVTGLAPALADNGGPTLTLALLPGSNAIDALPDCASADEAAGVLTDQRGTVRPQDGDGDGEAACDIGAFEVPNLAHRVYLPSMLRP